MFALHACVCSQVHYQIIRTCETVLTCGPFFIRPVTQTGPEPRRCLSERSLWPGGGQPRLQMLEFTLLGVTDLRWIPRKHGLIGNNVADEPEKRQTFTDPRGEFPRSGVLLLCSVCAAHEHMAAAWAGGGPVEISTQRHSRLPDVSRN